MAGNSDGELVGGRGFAADADSVDITEALAMWNSIKVANEKSWGQHLH